MDAAVQRRIGCVECSLIHCATVGANKVIFRRIVDADNVAAKLISKDLGYIQIAPLIRAIPLKSYIDLAVVLCRQG